MARALVAVAFAVLLVGCERIELARYESGGIGSHGGLASYPEPLNCAWRLDRFTGEMCCFSIIVASETYDRTVKKQGCAK